jgi:tetratricopeptide (TPR) repeat protein
MVNYKAFLTGAALLLFSFNCEAQKFQERLKDLYAANDTAAQSALLREWELKDPRDPELYVTYFNHYLRKSREAQMVRETMPQDKNAAQPADSSGDIAAYMNSMAQLNDVYLEKAFEYIEKGIVAFPARLDMRMGKIYMLGQKERYDEFTYDIIQMVEQSNTNKNVWTGTDHQPQKDAKKLMLSAVQEYVVQLYNTNDFTLLEDMRQISQTVLKYYPNHIESLSNLSIVYLLKKQYDKALEPLLKAEKLSPKDVIVLSNIAKAYKLKEDYKNAIAYYELTLKYGDAQVKKYSQDQIEALKKK